jgi:hypothetical protein
MAVEPVPYVLSTEAVQNPAILFRRALGSLLNPAGGLVAAGQGTVKAKATPNMGIEVEPLEIWIPGTTLPTQGMYYGYGNTATALAIGAASTSNPRVDTIIARIEDSGYAGSANEFCLEVLAGTPTSGITKPPKTGAEATTDKAAAIPASSMVLAYALVPQNASSITSGDIENVAPTFNMAETSGAWSPLTLSSGIVAGSAYTPSARHEPGGLVRLKGALENTSGSTKALGTTLATLPSAALYPASVVEPAVFVQGETEAGNISGRLQITHAGAIALTVNLPKLGAVSLDGITVSLS